MGDGGLRGKVYVHGIVWGSGAREPRPRSYRLWQILLKDSTVVSGVDT